MTDPDRKIIIDAITRMLARREHSRVEARTKLTQKGFEPEAFMPVLQEFTEAGIQSDARYAEMRIRACASKGIGPERVQRELSQHQIDSYVVQEAMREADVDWFELALNVKIKKFGEGREVDFKARQKQMQFMNYRGFTRDQIQYAVNGD